MLTWKEVGQLLLLLALGGLLGLGAGYLSVRAEGRTPPSLAALRQPPPVVGPQCRPAAPL